MKANRENTQDTGHWRFPAAQDRQDYQKTRQQNGGNSARDAHQWKRESHKVQPQEEEERGKDSRWSQRGNSANYVGGNRTRSATEDDRRRKSYRRDDKPKRDGRDNIEKVAKLEKELREMKQQLDRALGAQEVQENASKYNAFILDTGFSLFPVKALTVTSPEYYREFQNPFVVWMCRWI